jgi:hypothetical protein
MTATSGAEGLGESGQRGLVIPADVEPTAMAPMSSAVASLSRTVLWPGTGGAVFRLV